MGIFDKKKGTKATGGRASKKGSEKAPTKPPIPRTSSRIRKSIPTPPTTPAPGTSIAVRDDDNVELLTPDTKRAVDREREAIRKQLFSSSTGAALPFTRAATNQSQEITCEGVVMNAAENDGKPQTDATTTSTTRRPEREPSSTRPEKPPKSVANAAPRETTTVAATMDPNNTSFTTEEEETSLDSQVHRGPVSVDTPGRIVQTSPGKPFDEVVDDDQSSEPSEEEITKTAGPEATTSSLNTASMPPGTLDETMDSTMAPGDTSTMLPGDTSTTLPGDTSTMFDTLTDTNSVVLSAARQVSFACENGVVQNVQRAFRELGKTGQKVIDLFYDTDRSQQKDRPYYDAAFTHRFVHRMTTKGAALLALQAPKSKWNHTLDWKGRTVTMLLEKGSISPRHHKEQLQPRLEWTTIAGGQSFDVATTSVPLLDIMTITAAAKDIEGDSQQEADDNLCFFTITTSNGDVHVFEANAQSERDSIVNGLKNVISRLAFHLLVGDTTASSELFDVDDHETEEEPADLPALPSPQQAMNRIAHALLDG